MNEFTSILISGAGSNAAIAIAFPTALGVLMPMSDVTIKAIAIIAIVFLSAVNYFGVKGGTLVQNIFTVAKVIPIILIIVLGISQGNQTVNLSLTISSGENFFDIVSMIALAVMTTMWAYDSWTNLNSITEEIKAPQKNARPRFTLIGFPNTGQNPVHPLPQDQIPVPDQHQSHEKHWN